MHLQVKKKKKNLKVDLFATPDKSFFGSYHHPLGRDKLLIYFCDLHCISLRLLVTADFS